MIDTPGNGADKDAHKQPPQPPLMVNGQYVKDLSFESPNSPGILSELQKHQPNITINVNIINALIEGPGVPANLYEVVLELHAELKLDDKVGFIVELKYAGVFTLNVPKEHLTAFLQVECPRILFPFARQILADSTQAGGFMPLMLQPIDFAAMYQARIQHDMNNLSADVTKMDADVAKMVTEKGNA